MSDATESYELNGTIAQGNETQEAVRSLRSEVERLTKWLLLIDGGDNPCLDQEKLRQAAYDAVTLGKEPPEHL